MVEKIKIAFLGFLLATLPLNLSCGIKIQSANAGSPNKSYVKVFRELNVIECQKDKKCKKGQFGSVGSGFSIYIHKKYNTIMTAGHVCDTGITIDEFGHVSKYSVNFKVLNHENKVFQATPIIIYDKSKNIEHPDLCMLYVKDMKIPKLKFSRKAPKIGQKIISMSSPGGIYHPPVVPLFHGLYSGPISKNTALATVASSPGSSGGAIMTENHKVVGVIYAVSVYNNTITLINDYDVTKKFIGEVQEIIENYEKQSK
jgi:S1-C subfamily serine protease